MGYVSTRSTVFSPFSVPGMPKQAFDVIDYMGPLVVAAAFSLIVFVLCATVINFCMIRNDDDLTVFEKVGRTTLQEYASYQPG